jgi:GNAT superfamily N-acetyltransferase
VGKGTDFFIVEIGPIFENWPNLFPERPMVTYQTLLDPDAAALRPIDAGLHRHNLHHLGAATLSRYRRLAVTARDADGAFLGGVHGEVVWEWLYIHALWVAEAARGRGIGARLLAQLEAAARGEGAVGGHLETTEFQALDFYLKAGYTIFGELEGKPAGHTWYFLQKRWT